MLLPLLVFFLGSVIVGAAAFALMPNRAVAIDRRLEELTSGRLSEDDESKPRMDRLLGFVKRVGEKAPRSTKELSTLRQRLVMAGYRRDEAMTVFFGIRVVFALMLFALFATSLLSKPNITLALGGLALGYVLPGMVLARLAKKRAKRVQLALADALDLLVVSVEAGLGLDQALQRVGRSSRSRIRISPTSSGSSTSNFAPARRVPTPCGISLTAPASRISDRS